MNNIFNDDRYSSHSPTLKNNEDLQVFKKPTITTTKFCSDVDNNSKRTAKDFSKKKTHNFFYSLANYMVFQPKKFNKISEKCGLARNFRNIFGKKIGMQEFRFFFKRIYYFFFRPFLYFLGSCNYFIVNYYSKMSTISENQFFFEFELLFLANGMFENILKGFELKNKKNSSSKLIKFTLSSFLLLLFFIDLFICLPKTIFLVLNIFRLLRLKKMFEVFSKLTQKNNFKIYHGKFKNDQNQSFSKKKNSDFFFQLCYTHFLFVVFCSNVAFLLIYENDDNYEFLDIFNGFLDLSRFSGASFILTSPLDLSKVVFNLCFYAGIVILLFYFFFIGFNGKNYHSSKFGSKKKFNNFTQIAVFGNFDAEKFIFSVKNNNAIYSKCKFAFVFPENQKILKEMINFDAVSEIYENANIFSNSKLENILKNSEKIYFFIDKIDKNYLDLCKLLQKKNKKHHVFLFSENIDSKFENFGNFTKFSFSEIKTKITSLNLIFPGMQSFLFDLLKIYDPNSKNSNYSIGIAKVSIFLEKLKFSDIFRIFFFFPISEEFENSIILLGVCHDGKLITENLSNYSVQPNDELFFMSETPEKHKKFIENFSSKEFNNFRDVADFMEKQILLKNDEICKNEEKKILESFFEKSTNFGLKNEPKKFFDLPLFINLFKIQNFEKNLQFKNENSCVIFAHDQKFALELLKTIRTQSSFRLLVFCDSEITENLWNKKMNFREILFLFGKWQSKKHLSFLKISNSAKIFLHKSINHCLGKDRMTFFLLKTLRENFGSPQIFLDLETYFSMDFLQINQKDKFQKKLFLSSEFSFYDLFFKICRDDTIIKILGYFLPDSQCSLNFFKIKVNEQICDYFPDFGSLIWKILKLKLGFPFFIKHLFINKTEKISKIWRNEKMSVNDEILFFTANSDENPSDFPDESKTRNPFANSGVNISKEEIDRKNFTFTKVEEREKMDEFLDFNEKTDGNKVGFLSSPKIKGKIILKEQMIKALKFSMKVCEDFA